MEKTTSVYWLPLSVLIILTCLFLLFNYFNRRPPATAKSGNHCPCTHPIIGNLIAFLRNRHRFLDWFSDLLSSAPALTIEVRGPFDLNRGVCTADPSGVDRLLRSNFPNYIKGERFRSVLSDLLGRGIFNADANIWALQRKIASREFTTRSLRSFVAHVVRSETQNRLLPLLSAASATGDPVDLQDILRRFAFDNICAIAFGTDPASLDHSSRQPQSFFRAFDDAVEISSARFFVPLLSRFMAAVNQDDGELSLFFKDEKEKRRFLRDIVVSFVLAGKDTTSSALTWFFWLLWANPRCEKRILAELSELEGGEESGYDELKARMHYLHAAISESLRLYPPVPIDSKVTVADDVLPDGTRVRAGWFADYSAYAMARSEAVWGEDCREFVPERWLDERGEFVPADPFKFPVFHAGPRTCLGREMAYVQMKAVAVAVIRGFEVEAVAGVREVAPPYELSLTLRMKGGFPVRVKRRTRG